MSSGNKIIHIEKFLCGRTPEEGIEEEENHHDREPCISKCQGQSCCDCCGKAPAMHRCGPDCIPFQLYDPDCCANTRWTKPEDCMFLCGKTRDEWLKEPTEEKENHHDHTDT